METNDHFNSSEPTAQTVSLTAAAAKAAKQYQSDTPEFAGQDLRLYLSGKGCDGFEYGVAFSKAEAGDHIIDSGLGINVLVDPKTIVFVQGATIDWVDDERGRGFLVDNPGHKKFRGKFYKRENWQERLLGGQA